jgi:hypothetical protein
MQQGSTHEDNHLCAMFYLVLDHMSMWWLNGQETMVEPGSYANLWCASLCRKLHWHVSMFFALFFCLSFEDLGWSFVSFVSFAAVRATPPVLSTWHCRIYNWMKKGQNMPVGLSKMALAQHFCTVCELCQSFASGERATPGVLSMRPCKLIIGWRKAKTCRFGSAKWPFCAGCWG